MESLKKWSSLTEVTTFKGTGKERKAQLKLAVNARKPAASFLKCLYCPDVLEALAAEEKNLVADEGAPSLKWHSQSLDSRKALVRTKAWQLSILPVKTLAMNCIMIYMTGGGGGFFSIIIIGYALLTAVRTLLAVGKTFDDLEVSSGVKISTILQRAVYSALSLVFISYFTFQSAKLGLLPTSDVDVGTAARSFASSAVSILPPP